MSNTRIHFATKKLLISGLALAAVTSVNAHAFELGDLLKAAASTQATEAPAPVAATPTSALGNISNAVIGNLTSQLGISKAQAVGGLAILVGYAGNQLPPAYGDQLKQLFPVSSDSSNGLMGNVVGNLMGKVDSRSAVDKAFSNLGMQPAMVDSFTPLIETSVAATGANDLAGAMAKLW